MTWLTVGCGPLYWCLHLGIHDMRVSPFTNALGEFVYYVSIVVNNLPTRIGFPFSYTYTLKRLLDTSINVALFVCILLLLLQILSDGGSASGQGRSRSTRS